MSGLSAQPLHKIGTSSFLNLLELNSQDRTTRRRSDRPRRLAPLGARPVATLGRELFNSQRELLDTHQQGGQQHAEANAALDEVLRDAIQVEERASIEEQVDTLDDAIRNLVEYKSITKVSEATLDQRGLRFCSALFGIETKSLFQCETFKSNIEQFKRIIRDVDSQKKEELKPNFQAYSSLKSMFEKLYNGPELKSKLKKLDRVFGFKRSRTKSTAGRASRKSIRCAQKQKRVQRVTVTESLVPNNAAAAGASASAGSAPAQLKQPRQRIQSRQRPQRHLERANVAIREKGVSIETQILELDLAIRSLAEYKAIGVETPGARCLVPATTNFEIKHLFKSKEFKSKIKNLKELFKDMGDARKNQFKSTFQSYAQIKHLYRLLNEEVVYFDNYEFNLESKIDALDRSFGFKPTHLEEMGYK